MLGAFFFEDVRYNVCSIPLIQSFSHPLGVMAWTAQTAHWSLRNSLLKGGLPSFESFLQIWVKTVRLVAF